MEFNEIGINLHPYTYITSPYYLRYTQHIWTLKW